MTSVPGFLTKTFEIFSCSDYIDCCGWGPRGDTIIIKKIEQFSKQILPKYFKHSNFQSFVRQLNMYDFHKTVQDPNHGEFQHQYFRQNQPELLVYIKRKANNRATTESLKKLGTTSNTTSSTALTTLGNKFHTNSAVPPVGSSSTKLSTQSAALGGVGSTNSAGLLSTNGQAMSSQAIPITIASNSHPLNPTNSYISSNISGSLPLAATIPNANISSSPTFSNNNSNSTAITKILPAEIVAETGAVLQELKLQRSLQSDFERRMESRLSKLEGENTVLKKMFMETHQKNLRMQERMERVLKVLYNVFIANVNDPNAVPPTPTSNLLLQDAPSSSSMLRGNINSNGQSIYQLSHHSRALLSDAIANTSNQNHSVNIEILGDEDYQQQLPNERNAAEIDDIRELEDEDNIILPGIETDSLERMQSIELLEVPMENITTSNNTVEQETHALPQSSSSLSVPTVNSSSNSHLNLAMASGLAGMELAAVKKHRDSFHQQQSSNNHVSTSGTSVLGNILRSTTSFDHAAAAVSAPSTNTSFDFFGNRSFLLNSFDEHLHSLAVNNHSTQDNIGAENLLKRKGEELWETRTQSNSDESPHKKQKLTPTNSDNISEVSDSDTREYIHLLHRNQNTTLQRLDSLEQTLHFLLDNSSAHLSEVATEPAPIPSTTGAGQSAITSSQLQQNLEGEKENQSQASDGNIHRENIASNDSESAGLGFTDTDSHCDSVNNSSKSPLDSNKLTPNNASSTRSKPLTRSSSAAISSNYYHTK